MLAQEPGWICSSHALDIPFWEQFHSNVGTAGLGNWEFWGQQHFTQFPVGSNPIVSYICYCRPGKFNWNQLSSRCLVGIKLKSDFPFCCGEGILWSEVDWLLLASGLSLRCVYTRLFVFGFFFLAPTDLLAQILDCTFSPSLHILFHLPSLLFLPQSSNFPLLTPNGVFTSSDRPPCMLAQVSTPRVPLRNISHALHYLLNVFPKNNSALQGAGTVTMVFPRIVVLLILNTWPIWVIPLSCMKEQKDECEMQVKWLVGGKDVEVRLECPCQNLMWTMSSYQTSLNLLTHPCSARSSVDAAKQVYAPSIVAIIGWVSSPTLWESTCFCLWVDFKFL